MDTITPIFFVFLNINHNTNSTNNVIPGDNAKVTKVSEKVSLSIL